MASLLSSLERPGLQKLGLERWPIIGFRAPARIGGTSLGRTHLLRQTSQLGLTRACPRPARRGRHGDRYGPDDHQPDARHRLRDLRPGLRCRREYRVDRAELHQHPAPAGSDSSLKKHRPGRVNHRSRDSRPGRCRGPQRSSQGYEYSWSARSDREPAPSAVFWHPRDQPWVCVEGNLSTSRLA